MKNLIITLVLVAFSLCAEAQSLVCVNTVPNKELRVKKQANADVTVCEIVHPIDRKKYLVYKGARGSLYIKRGKSGKEYLKNTLRKQPEVLAKIEKLASKS